ncbi:DUF2070 family protein [Candidatus Micrarchaeota archaeon]|nr:DUF2070 family protein [Candidatus Micrarchaeota archaeon]
MLKRKPQASMLAGISFSVPSPSVSVAYLFAISFAAGFLSRFFYAPGGLAGIFLYGGADGILLLAFPALFAAVFSTAFLSRKEFRKGLKYNVFLSLASAVVAAVIYFVGLVAENVLGARVDVGLFVLVANAFIFIFWFMASFVAFNAGWKAFVTSFFQPFFNLSFLFLWTRFTAFETSFAVENPVLGFFKLFVAAMILLLALWAFFFIVNAPWKRNLGVSALQASTLYFAQFLRGSKDFEQVLNEISENVSIPVSVFAFRKRGGRKLKALFVIPTLHFGPFGNVGGSEYPALVSRELEKRFHAPAFIFHALVNHDLNPIYSSDFVKVADAVSILLEKGSGECGWSDKACFASSSFGVSNVSSLVFGVKNADAGFASVSRAPESTDDFDYALGLALHNALLKHYERGAVTDRHNSLGPLKLDGSGGIEKIYAGGKAFEGYESAVDGLRVPKSRERFALGIASDPMSSFSVKQGIAGMGLRVAVFQFGGRKHCIVLIDGNNSSPEFRNRLVSLLKKRFGFEFADLFTTDNHAVNSLSAVNNPLPSLAGEPALLQRVEAAAVRAVKDLEECEAFFASKKINLNVLGSERESEFLATINSVIAVAKIIAPLILFASIALVIGALLLLK